GQTMRKALEGIDAFVAGRQPVPFAGERRDLPLDGAVVGRARETLSRVGAPSGDVEKLLEHLRTAPDDQVTGMRAFALADRWGSPRVPTLRMFLHATRAGLLDLRWSIRCPSCRVVKVDSGRLSDLRREVHCDACNIRFDGEFDQSVEVRFSVHPALRKAEAAEYCMGGPHATPHVRAQVVLAPGATREVAVTLPAGEYRVWAPQAPGHECRLRVGAGGKAEAEVAIAAGSVAPATLETREGRLALRLRNGGAGEMLARVETLRPDDRGASAALVTSLQDFRDLFSSEVLAPGAEMAVKTLTFLFTDLKGSTAYYERAGSARAYAMVREHFALWTEVIRAREGGIVKTMGDAIMAVYTDPVAAVATALDAQKRTMALPGERPIVKVGIHEGPCIAVSANEILDYFGSTVNVAARIQGESHGDDIVLGEALATDPRIRDALAAAGARTERYETVLKGIPGMFKLTRVRLG
ncbi:MAG: adenylate/guanylate cyclase domain-containing protein, partial [Planctomycetales bacterium]|nr:adenylate/guanylate cyclase domain-containing protein [Planctomycetales bacterium]